MSLVHNTDIKIGMVIRPARCDVRRDDEDDRLFAFKQQVNTMLVEWVGQKVNHVIVAGRYVYDTKLLSPHHGAYVGDPVTMNSFSCGDDMIILSNPYMPDGKGWTDE